MKPNPSRFVDEDVQARDSLKTSDKIYCKVCNKLYVDDNEFICHSCVEKWRDAIIKNTKAQTRKEILDLIEKCEWMKYDGKWWINSEELIERIKQLEGEGK